MDIDLQMRAPESYGEMQLDGLIWGVPKRAKRTGEDTVVIIASVTEMFHKRLIEKYVSLVGPPTHHEAGRYFYPNGTKVKVGVVLTFNGTVSMMDAYQETNKFFDMLFGLLISDLSDSLSPETITAEFERVFAPVSNSA